MTQERNNTDCNVFIDRAIKMMNECWETDLVAGKNGVLSLLQYAKESHAVATPPPQGLASDDIRLKEIARLAWISAANAYRLYPDSKHTFTQYWTDLGDTDCRKLFPESASPQTDAVAFAEWLQYQGYERNNSDKFWYNYPREDVFPMGDLIKPTGYTTEQLYQIFKQNK